MTRLRWKKTAAGKKAIDFRDDGYRPPDELQRKADAAFDEWLAKLPPGKRRGLTKRLRTELSQSRVVPQEADRRIAERIRLGPPLARLMGKET